MGGTTRARSFFCFPLTKIPGATLSGFAVWIGWTFGGSGERWID
jgi:hypothetical protein